MAKKSDNTQGNPYHDESTGEFTSADDASVSVSKEQSPLKLKTPAAPTLKLKSGSDVSNLQAFVNDLNQCSNVPRLASARDIEQHIEQYFSKPVCEKIAELYGSGQSGMHYQFSPKSNPNVFLNIFTCVIGKYRYKDNHAHVVDANAFYSLTGGSVSDFNSKVSKNNGSWYGRSSAFSTPNDGIEPIFRGITSRGDKRRSIIDSYGTMDLNNFDIYGNGIHGTNVYTTTNLNYAKNYGIPIVGFLDTRNSYSMDTHKVEQIMYSINADDSFIQKVNDTLIKNGVEQDKAGHISRSFAKSIRNDRSLVAILLGLDYQISDNHQRNLLNLNRWYINKDESTYYGY